MQAIAWIMTRDAAIVARASLDDSVPETRYPDLQDVEVWADNNPGLQPFNLDLCCAEREASDEAPRCAVLSSDIAIGLLLGALRVGGVLARGRRATAVTGVVLPGDIDVSDWATVRLDIDHKADWRQQRTLFVHQKNERAGVYEIDRSFENIVLRTADVLAQWSAFGSDATSSIEGHSGEEHASPAPANIAEQISTSSAEVRPVLPEQAARRRGRPPIYRWDEIEQPVLKWLDENGCGLSGDQARLEEHIQVLLNGDGAGETSVRHFAKKMIEKFGQKRAEGQ